MPRIYKKSSAKSEKSNRKKSKKRSNKKKKNSYIDNICTDKTCHANVNIQQTDSLIKDNKNNGMVTAIWGPSAWFFLHIITFNYPINPTEDDKLNYYNFFYNLQFILPCGKCRINYQKNINEEDTKLSLSTFNDRETLKMWLYKLHNKVNLLTHKNVNIKFDEVNKKYEQYRAICDSSNKLHVGCTTPQYKKLNGKTCEIKIISKK